VDDGSGVTCGIDEAGEDATGDDGSSREIILEGDPDPDPGQADPAGTDDQPAPTARRYGLSVVIGQDVVDALTPIVEGKAREAVERQGGDLASVELGGQLQLPRGGPLDQQLQAVAAAVAAGLRAADVRVDLAFGYSYSQLYTMAVGIVGRLLQTYPYNGKVRWRIGCRVEQERGIVYRRLVAPMVAAGIAQVQSAVDARVRTFLSQSGLDGRFSVQLQRVAGSWPETTLTVYSSSQAVLTVTMSELQRAIDRIVNGD